MKNKKILCWIIICIMIITCMIQTSSYAEVTELPETDEIDISENHDGSAIATWNKSDRTLRISGSGRINISIENDDYYNKWDKYTDVVETVIIESGITEIGDNLFAEFKKLRSLTIPNTVSKIDEYAFSDCYLIENITIPNGVSTINTAAFSNCKSLNSISFPKSLINLEERIFKGCNSLRNINVDSDNSSYTSINGVLYTKDRKELVCYPMGKQEIEYTINENVTKIDRYAFDECSNLNNVIMPNNLNTIDVGAFHKCSGLINITIPGNVTTIKSGAFYGCSNLEKIYIPNSVVNIADSTVFKNCNKLQIACSENSYAENYAKNNNIPYIIQTEEPNDETPIAKINVSINSSNVKNGDEIEIIIAATEIKKGIKAVNYSFTYDDRIFDYIGETEGNQWTITKDGNTYSARTKTNGATTTVGTIAVIKLKVKASITTETFTTISVSNLNVTNEDNLIAVLNNKSTDLNIKINSDSNEINNTVNNTINNEESTNTVNNIGNNTKNKNTSDITENTTAKGTLPQTGEKTFLIITGMLVLLGTGIISFKLYEKDKIK